MLKTKKESFCINLEKLVFINITGDDNKELEFTFDGEDFLVIEVEDAKEVDYILAAIHNYASCT